VSTVSKTVSRIISASVLGSLAGIVSFTVLPGVARAADESASADSSLELQEVVVTANKLNATKVLDTPASIQAISGDALQNAGVSGIMDVAGQIPGLSIQDLGPGDKKYVIRGINSTGDATTGVYYGEAVISGSNADDGGGFESDIRLYDLDHIEVLRGPQGTLYGASSMSGTLRFIPKTPDLNTVSGYGTVEGSETAHTERGNYNFNGAVNLQLIDGVLAVRLVGWKEYDAGYINQIRVGTGVVGTYPGTVPKGDVPPALSTTQQALGTLNGINDDDVGGGRVMVRYKPLDNLTIDANYTSQTETSNGSSRYTPAGTAGFSGGTVAPIQGCDLCNTDVTQSPWSDNIKVFGTTIAYDTGFGTLTGTTNQYNRTTDFSFDSTPILLTFPAASDQVPGETLEPRERKVNSSEIRYASAFDSPVNFVAGVYREHDTQHLAVQVLATNGFGLPVGPFCTGASCDAGIYPGVGTTFFGRTDDRSGTQYAGFGEVTWKATDKLTAVAGIRYFTESLEGVQETTHNFGGFPDQVTGVPLPDPNEKFNKITWKGNVSYKFDDALLAYGTVSTGFRSGGLNAVSQPFEPIPASYAPDTLTNFEVGAKGRVLNGLFDYQADVYFIRWNNIQVQETTPDGAFVYQGNAGEAKVKGLELELTAHPMQYLAANLAGSWQEAYLSFGADQQIVVPGSPGVPPVTAYDINPTLGRTGDAIPNVPRFQADFGLNYTRPIVGDWVGMAAADANFRGKENSYFASNAFNIPLSEYTLVNFRLGVIKGPWSVTAFARNLTDKRAQVSAINSSQDPDALLTVQPRTIGLTATWKF
jgi:outer membrane receptor protein involved in Fe transport